MTTDATFKGLAFPVVKVRFAGPTNSRGSRYIATLGRTGYGDETYRTTVNYDHGMSASANALAAARACLAKRVGDRETDYVAIPGSLDTDAYAFTFVPSGYFGEGS